jgi:O-Antigen ligase
MTFVKPYNPELADGAENPLAASASSKGGWAIIAIAVVSATLLLSPAATLLLYAFPFMSVVAALYLYRRSLPNYVTLVCWLWFLTPLVRRMLDYRAGWTQPTAVLLGPPLASCVPALWLIPDWREIFQRRAAPLLCILATCLYATVLGLVNLGPRFVFQDLLTWFAPLIFAFTLLRHSDQVADLFDAFENSFLYGTIVVSVYGLVQFFFLPSWDAFWMSWVKMDSIGRPLPTEVRVFSTMNAPQILASFLAVGVVMAFNSRRRIRFLTIPLGLVCLALSLARSGWVAMVAGMLYLFFTLSQRQRFRMVVVAVLSVVAMIAALQNPDLQEVMSQRFETLSDVRNDDSFMDRIDAYREMFDGFMTTPFGLGMGATPAIAEDTVIPRRGWNQDLGDSTVAMIMTTMGLAGGLVLVCSLVLLGKQLFHGETVNPAFTQTMQAVLIGLIAEAALDGVVSGPTGFLTWSSVGFCIALSVTGEESEPVMATAAVAV